MFSIDIDIIHTDNICCPVIADPYTMGFRRVSFQYKQNYEYGL